MKHKLWLLIGLIVLLVAAGGLALLRYWQPGAGETPTPGVAASPTPTATPTPTFVAVPASPTPSMAAPEWSDLPTVTPPAPGEPTVPAEALAMRVAPTATPSPIPLSPTPSPTATPTATPVPATGYDDVEMVEVPAGEFVMGSTHQQISQYISQNWDQFSVAGGDYLYDQTPQLTIYLDTFTLDHLEVTIARYQQCVDAGICRAVPALKTLPNNYPVVGVTWYDAVTYCQWVDKRLPTEAEWEKAARGDDGRWYPWGNEWNKNWANPSFYVDDLKPVGSYPEGTSPYGVLDMGGNALEWVVFVK
ncbi:MAG TPA: SUMF1/EgtB/PvdO family nonheme iron enzyme [Anaerolineae bacterium]|nr:SUMF1/EgtB/PvdO family nonheme iron enzyme [Anaerolineae bacterium]